MEQQRHFRTRQRGYRCKAVECVEREIAYQQRRNQIRGTRYQHDGMAIGRRLERRLGGDHTAAARPVVGEHLLAPTLGQTLADQLAKDAGGAARSIRTDNANRLGGIGRLGSGGTGKTY